MSVKLDQLSASDLRVVTKAVMDLARGLVEAERGE